MSQHPSLRSDAKGKAHRSVWKRFERLRFLVEKDKWGEAKSIFGLPKMKLLKIKIKKEKPAEALAEGAAGAAAEGAAQAEGKGAAAQAKGAQPKAAAGKEVPGIRVHVRGGVRRPPVPASVGVERALELAEEVARRLEMKVRRAHRPHSSDISRVPEGIPALEGLGPLGGEVRTPNEHILRDSLVERAALLALLIRRAAKEQS